MNIKCCCLLCTTSDFKFEQHPCLFSPPSLPSPERMNVSRIYYFLLILLIASYFLASFEDSHGKPGQANDGP